VSHVTGALGALLLVSAVVVLAGLPCRLFEPGQLTPRALAVWFPGRYPPRCDRCGGRHDGDCPAATPVRPAPTWAREETR
jgi:hypothetical protein